MKGSLVANSATHHTRAVPEVPQFVPQFLPCPRAHRTFLPQAACAHHDL